MKKLMAMMMLVFSTLCFAQMSPQLMQKAEQGDAQAQYNLGVMYRNGKEVPRDYVKAQEWLEKAALQGYAPAQASLGNMYHFGRGVAKDFTLAKEWLRITSRCNPPLKP